ncbi:unnamed protein product [Notodromas monacha]|uniref:Uncharacterized protein n=1 Tax=Notodromas monacha TaxID=399045 RepID=A0A7R9GG70_9CRUS|nr:unnamed protein product [Notodromas monacha]CAG0921527.1 unnamed protein product [Notodromas monacha]
MDPAVLLPFLAAACAASLLPLHQHPLYHGVHFGKYTEDRSQFHAQTPHGGYNYGYAEPNGAKKETRHPDGTVTGTYSHPLPDGRTLTNNYVADAYGFRSNLAPTAPKDFSPIAVAAYDVSAPVYQHSVHAVAVPRPPIHVTKAVDYHQAAPYGYGYHH